MRIIEAIVGDPRRGPRADRVEAEVALTLEPHPGAPAETRTVPASVPALDPKGRDLRTRLVADAVLRARAAPAVEAA